MWLFTKAPRVRSLLYSTQVLRNVVSTGDVDMQVEAEMVDFVARLSSVLTFKA